MTNNLLAVRAALPFVSPMANLVRTDGVFTPTQVA
jgi:hypothetical protein